MSFFTLIRTPSMSLGTIGPIFVQSWVPGSTDADFDVLEAAMLDFAKVHPKFMSLAVLRGLDPKGMELGKKRGLALLKKTSPYLLGMATLIPAPGVKGSIARTFMSAFNMMSNVTIPTRVFAQVEDTLRWFDTLSDQMGPLPELQRGTREIETFLFGESQDFVR